MANLLDGLVSLFSPETAIRRARARYALQALRRGYDGAKTGRLTSGLMVRVVGGVARLGVVPVHTYPV